MSVNTSENNPASLNSYWYCITYSIFPAKNIR